MKREVNDCSDCPFSGRTGHLPPKCAAPTPSVAYHIWTHILEKTTPVDCPLRSQPIIVVMEPT